MKQLIILFTLITGLAQAQDFQQVYTVDHTADNIRTAAGTIDQFIYCTKWGVAMQFEGDVTLEAKDGRYRLTFDRMYSADSGVLLSDLPQSQKSCQKAMAAYGEDLHHKIAQWEDF